MEKYKELLMQLVNFKNPDKLSAIMEQLQAFDKKRGDRIVQLSREQLASILQRYISGELTPHDVEEWANALEIREDIEFGIDNDPPVTDVIWELANPLLAQPLSVELAQKFIEHLDTY